MQLEWCPWCNNKQAQVFGHICPECLRKQLNRIYQQSFLKKKSQAKAIEYEWNCIG